MKYECIVHFIIVRSTDLHQFCRFFSFICIVLLNQIQKYIAVKWGRMKNDALARVINFHRIKNSYHRCVIYSWYVGIIEAYILPFCGAGENENYNLSWQYSGESWVHWVRVFAIFMAKSSALLQNRSGWETGNAAFEPKPLEVPFRETFWRNYLVNFKILFK